MAGSTTSQGSDSCWKEKRTLQILKILLLVIISRHAVLCADEAKANQTASSANLGTTGFSSNRISAGLKEALTRRR